MCDPHVEGKPWPYAPRVILKNQLAALADRGMSLNAGAEPEYFLVKKDAPAASRSPTSSTTRACPATTPRA